MATEVNYKLLEKIMGVGKPTPYSRYKFETHRPLRRLLTLRYIEVQKETDTHVYVSVTKLGADQISSRTFPSAIHG